MSDRSDEWQIGMPSVRWSAHYEPRWDATPDAYAEAGIVPWGRSRRLMRADDTRLGMKAYLGVQHSDPSRWGLPGDARTRFFLSVLLGKRTLFLRTFDTASEAFAVLHEIHDRLMGQAR
ncbi:MAG TPA: hypothetical protein VF792_00190 [Ktedonobacterales bacterium]